jgi:8-oxo-dGTP diphosphatase
MKPPLDMVAGFLFWRMGIDVHQQVALIQKSHPAWQRGRWNAIGGKIESGETPLQAMIREFHEEAGPRITEWSHFATLIGGGETPWRVFFFRHELIHINRPQLKDVNAEPGHDPEAMRWHYYLPPDALPNLAWLIPMADRSCASTWPLAIAEPTSHAGVHSVQSVVS